MATPMTMDLSPLSFFLYRQGVPHKITEEAGAQVVWTTDDALIPVIMRHYQDWQEERLILEAPPKRQQHKISTIIANISWRKYFVTFLFLIICVAVTLASWFGEAWWLVSKLTFVPVHRVSDGSGGALLYFGTLSMVSDHSQYWRFITPIFLHFNVLHLAFNMLWLFDLGKRIETRKGGLHLFLIILSTGVGSNLVQFFWGGTGLFGGFSGVVFGLLGYCMVCEKVDKSCQFGILPALYYFMLIYLVIGYTGIMDGLAGGSIANAAHTGGLLSGAVVGLLAGVLLRKKSAPLVEDEE
ncbi:MAG: rhomboid family intramembrane serine protease [Candidatus Endonucleobacter bathymodioli]|uniref:Rhomboid family intramembrane serine protease n=1 Tax=Candidatus Endonucleibacter bathymodioli TaxID=539814 RepID=A0AA90NLL4_9GAMM|nr:rhomboid family intramembrane serine protease [Candidatus Endonucleobacter bathymodioli]